MRVGAGVCVCVSVCVSGFVCECVSVCVCLTERMFSCAWMHNPDKQVSIWGVTRPRGLFEHKRTENQHEIEKVFFVFTRQMNLLRYEGLTLWRSFLFRLISFHSVYYCFRGKRVHGVIVFLSSWTCLLPCWSWWNSFCLFSLLSLHQVVKWSSYSACVVGCDVVLCGVVWCCAVRRECSALPCTG